MYPRVIKEREASAGEIYKEIRLDYRRPVREIFAKNHSHNFSWCSIRIYFDEHSYIIVYDDVSLSVHHVAFRDPVWCLKVRAYFTVDAGDYVELAVM